MRWVTKNGWRALVLMTMLGATGCTTSVIQAGAEDPRAFALLPLALVGDAIAAAAGDSSSSSSTPATRPDPSLASWDDPDDWVAECAGPLLCEAPRRFACYGTPGECFCACEMPTGGTSASGATASAR